MKILILGSFLTKDQGGTNQGLISFANGLTKTSFAEPVIYAYAHDPTLLNPSIPVISASFPRRGRFVWRFPSAYLVSQQAEELARHKLPDPDVAFTAHMHLAAAYHRVRPNVPLITHFGPVLAAREVMDVSQSWERRIEAQFIERIERRMYQEDSCAHVVSTKLVAEIRENHFGLPKGYFHICPYGTDINRFSRSHIKVDIRLQRGIPSDAFVVVTVARLVGWKRVDMVVDAVAKMPQDVYLLVVGDGPERQSLENRIHRLRVADRIHLAGWTHPVDWLAAADVFVLTSEIESFGLVYAEAMLLGLPCIGRRHQPPAVISSAEDVIPEGEAGFCVDSVEMLVDRLQLLRDNPSQRRKMGDTARILAEREYSVEHYIEFFRKTATNLINNHEAVIP